MNKLEEWIKNNPKEAVGLLVKFGIWTTLNTRYLWITKGELVYRLETEITKEREYYPTTGFTATLYSPKDLYQYWLYNIFKLPEIYHEQVLETKMFGC